MKSTNITELLGRNEIEKLLHLCGVSQERRRGGPSDYDLFVELLRAGDLFLGHEIADRLCALQEALFPSLALIPENAGGIWHRVAEALLLAETIQEKKADPSPLPLLQPISSVVDAACLLTAPADNLDEWRQAIGRFCLETGEVPIRILLPDGFAFASPNLYRVGQILPKQERTLAEMSMLAIQMVRELSASHRTLILSNTEAEELQKLCTYLQAHAKLPQLALEVPAHREIASFVSIAAAFDGVRLAQRADAADDHRLSAIARQYPIKRMLIY